MLMYQFCELFAHTARICTVQFALAFRSVSSGLELLLRGYGFGPQQF